VSIYVKLRTFWTPLICQVIIPCYSCWRSKLRYFSWHCDLWTARLWGSRWLPRERETRTQLLLWQSA